MIHYKIKCLRGSMTRIKWSPNMWSTRCLLPRLISSTLIRNRQPCQDQIRDLQGIASFTDPVMIHSKVSM